MPKLKEVVIIVEYMLHKIFGEQIPSWATKLLGYVLLLALLLVAIWALLLVISKIKKLFLGEIQPMFYKPMEKHRIILRQRFADHIESEIRRLNNFERWYDYRFAELEAEVEAEGSRFSLISAFTRTYSRSLRRESSLSKALSNSKERLILLEGEPGSGKSVALRHVALEIAKSAMNSKRIDVPIPIYVNLKSLERNNDAPITPELISSFVLKELNRFNNRDIEEFLEQEFDKGLREGTWVFLFDSFDEIPEVLSSTESDTFIRRYGDAISDFLHGMNKCRGIIASRYFRGPVQFGWPRFRILPLTQSRRSELITRFGLQSETKMQITGQITLADYSVRSMSSNPMFLGLLCEYMRDRNPFPEHAHSVFENYLTNRLNRDEERLKRRYSVSQNEIREAAEKLAFFMSYDPGIGLNPSRDALKEASLRLGFDFGDKFHVYLDALEFIKLARSESGPWSGGSRQFTFMHRRFQEYFATCMVLREPHRVTPKQILTDARWRETAIVIFQTQPSEKLEAFISEARLLITQIVSQVPEAIQNPISLIESFGHKKTVFKQSPGTDANALFKWPPNALHILSILQDGFVGRIKDLPGDIRQQASRLLLTASEKGSIADRKWAIEVSGIADQPILLWTLRRAFASDSQWLKDVAYLQTARLLDIPKDVATSIKQAIMKLTVDGSIRSEYSSTYVHLSRLSKADEFISSLRLFSWIRKLDLIILFLIFVILPLVILPFIIGKPIVLNQSNIIPLTTLSLAVFWFTWFNPLYRDERLLSIRNYVSIGFLYTLLLVFVGTYKDAGAKNILFISIFPYFISWTPAALVCALQGWCTRPLLWTMIPFRYLYYGCSAPLWKGKIFVPRLILFILFIVIFTIANSGIGNPYLLYIIPVMGTMNLILKTITFIWLFFVLIYAVLWTVRTIRKSIDLITDSNTWLKFVHPIANKISSTDFLNLLGRFRCSSFRSRFLDLVLHRNLLLITEENESLLTSLSLAIEVVKRSTHFDLGPENVSEFSRWYQVWSKSSKNSLRAWSYKNLDGILRLLEHVRASRHGKEH